MGKHRPPKSFSDFLKGNSDEYLAALVGIDDKIVLFGTTNKFRFLNNEYINAPLEKNTRYGLAVLGYDNKNNVKLVSHFREIGVVIEDKEVQANFGVIIGFACFAVFVIGGCLFFVAKYFEPLKYKIKNKGKTLTGNSLGTNSNIGDNIVNVHDNSLSDDNFVKNG